MTKKSRRILIVTIAVLFALYWGAVNILVSAVLVPSFMEKLDAFDRIVEQSYAQQVQETELMKNSAAMSMLGRVWGRSPELERVEIVSRDGYRLRGVMAQAGEGAGEDVGRQSAVSSGEDAGRQSGGVSGEDAGRQSGGVSGEDAGRQSGEASGEDAGRQSGEGTQEENDRFSGAGALGHQWIVLLHGYTGSKEMMYGYAYWYSARGYSVLAPDFRCQGESEGDYIGLGATDSRDLEGWIDLILQRDPEAEIVLHGLSMGASTALIYSGREDIPDNVKAVIADCAYTDAYSMFQEKIGSWFHLPAFPVVDSAELMIRIRAGYDLKETSPLRAVAVSSVPTLFIHGKKDQMIPVKMCLELYNAAACRKEIMIVGGAGHAQSAEKDPVEYFAAVERFLGKVDDLKVH